MLFTYFSGLVNSDQNRYDSIRMLSKLKPLNYPHIWLLTNNNNNKESLFSFDNSPDLMYSIKKETNNFNGLVSSFEKIDNRIINSNNNEITKSELEILDIIWLHTIDNNTNYSSSVTSSSSISTPVTNKMNDIKHISKQNDTFIPFNTFTFKNDIKIKYKLCDYIKTHNCKFNDKCYNAHSIDEMIRPFYNDKIQKYFRSLKLKSVVNLNRSPENTHYHNKIKEIEKNMKCFFCDSFLIIELQIETRKLPQIKMQCNYCNNRNKFCINIY